MRTSRACLEMSAVDFLRQTWTICGMLCRADSPPASHPKIRIIYIVQVYIRKILTSTPNLGEFYEFLWRFVLSDVVGDDDGNE